MYLPNINYDVKVCFTIVDELFCPKQQHNELQAVSSFGVQG